MSNFPQNNLQNVSLYLRSYLALQSNFSAVVNNANTKFSNFNRVPGNLGSTVTFDEPPQAIAVPGLIASPFGAQQIVHTLAVDQAVNSAIAMDAQQIIFNMKNAPGGDYRSVFGRSMVEEISAQMEITGMKNFVSDVRPMTQQGSQTIVSQYGNANSGPSRFYGSADTPLNSYLQLAEASMLFRTAGQAAAPIDFYLPDFTVPPIVNSGLNQLVMQRNNESAMSWEVGTWGSPRNRMFRSNVTPTHISGTTGTLDQTLTVVSTNDPTGQNVTQITLSGATASDSEAVYAGDLFRFKDTAGYSTVRLLTRYGHVASIAPFDFRATVDAASSAGGQVTITLAEPLIWASGIGQNCSTAIVAGMTVQTNGSHRAGGLVGGDGLYLAMPELPQEYPFDSVTETDPNSKASFRLSFGTRLGENISLLILYQVSGWFLVPRYSTRILVPLYQTA